MQFSESVVQLLGVRIHDISVTELVFDIKQTVDSGRKEIYAYANIHAMNIAFELSWFRDFLNRSRVVFCDGFGVKLGAWFTGQRIQNRNTPPDFMGQICQLSVENRYKMFFLGAKPGVAEKAAMKLKNEFPSLQIMTHHGFFDFNSAQENQSVIDLINDFGTQILVLGFGMPLQESWITKNQEKLNANVVFPAGAVFDYISGEIYRLPRWMTDRGLEWLGRLIVEPRRLGKRYMIGNPLFFWRIFVHDVVSPALTRWIKYSKDANAQLWRRGDKPSDS